MGRREADADVVAACLIAPPAEPTKEQAKDDGRWECMRVQLLWFQATPGQMETVFAAKPDQQDKAIEFLHAKAKLWKECVVWNRNGEKTAWQDTESKMEIKNGEAVEEQTGVQLDGGYTRHGDEVTMSWTLELRVKSELAAAAKWASPMTPGQWTFVQLRDWPQATLVACRMMKE